MFRKRSVIPALWLATCVVGCASLDIADRTVCAAAVAGPDEGGEPLLARGADPLPEDTSLEASGDLPPLWAPVIRAADDVAGIDLAGTRDPAGCPTMTFSWHEDLANLPPELRCDLHSLWTRENVLLLAVGGGVSLAMHGNFDDHVAANTAKHPNRWGDVQDFFGAIGNPGHHFAAVTGLYAYSLATDDPATHELSKTLFNALAITGASTALLKLATNTTAPNGQSDLFGGSWPSGHTSSSVAVAAVLDEYYGHQIGIPAYILSGLVAWERIDDREHDVSDVVFGAVLGYVIGHTIAAEHHARFCGMELESYTDPSTGATGFGLERRY